MCGIFGVLKYGGGGLSREQVVPIRELVKQLAHFSTSRGRDSSGVCVMNNKELAVFKHHVPGTNIGEMNNFNVVMRGINLDQEFKCVIGHTRAQTQGTYKNNKNNHPIICGKTVGVHNGMISSDNAIFMDLRKKKIERIAQVDSEAIFALIDSHITDGLSFKDAIRKASEDLKGSYACAAVNADKKNSLMLFRRGSPIQMADFENLGIAVFASSMNIIRDALENTKGLKNTVTAWTTLPDDTGMQIFLKTGNTEKFDLVNPYRRDYSSGSFYGTYGGRNWSCPSATNCYDDCKTCATASAANLVGK